MNDVDPEQLKQNLEETREIVERNHEMLSEVKRWIFWQRVSTIVYWVVIIGVGIGLFYFLEPYVGRVMDAYGSLQEGLNSIPGTGG